MIHHAVALIGFVIFAGIAWLLSSNRRKVAWKTIAWAVGLQLLIGLIIFRLPVSHRILFWLNDAVLALLNASKSGSAFLFGPLAASPGESGSVGFILVFQVLPVVIFFAAFTAMLYHLRVLQVVVRLFARLFHRTMKISGAESLSSAANIFVGIESALVVRPYLERMTRSELLLILTTGMATVASSTLGVYVAFLTGVFPQIAGHLISASILAIPACVVVAKLLIPETETPETLAAVPPEDESSRSKSLIGAIIEGAMDGLKLAAGISALIIAILGIVALIDKLLGVASSWLGMSEPLSIVRILGWLFYPFAFLLGIQTNDVPMVARLLGERVILTEVFSYNHLAQMISSGEIVDPRTVVILSYALCGFAHVAAMAIFVGGTAALAPSRRDDLASLGLRALLAATLATLMTGCVAGMLSSGEGVLLFKEARSEVQVLSAVGMRQVMLDLGPKFESATGYKLKVSFDSGGVILKRLERGETADVVMINRAGIDGLTEAGRVVKDSVTDLAKARVGVAVREGAPTPDVSTPDAFRRAMLNAKTIACPDPALGGSSGVHIAKVFERLGISDIVKPKLVLVSTPEQPQTMPGHLVAEGKAEIALHQMQELISVPGVVIAGPLPGDLQETFVFSAAVITVTDDVKAAKALIDFLRTPQAQAIIKAKGMEPAIPVKE